MLRAFRLKTSIIRLDSPFFACLNTPRLKKIAIIALIVIWVISGIYTVNRQMHSSSADFREFYTVNHQLLHPIEERKHEVPYTYPPFFHVLIAAFSWMPLGIAAALWYLFCSASIFITVKLLYRIANNTNERLPPVFMGVPITMSIGLILNDLGMGNCNLVVLFCLVLCLYLFCLKREFLSGIALAASITLKFLPGIFLVYFLYKQRYRVVVGALIGSLIFTGLFPIAAFGPQKGLEVVKEWVNLMLPSGASAVNQVQERWFERENIYRGTNQSLRAVLHRFLQPVPAIRGQKPMGNVNVVSFPQTVVNIIYVILVAAILTISAFLLRLPPATTGQPPLVMLEFSFVIFLMLLLSPVTWVNYLVHMIVCHFALFHFLRRLEPSSADYQITLKCLIAAFILSILGATPLTQALAVPFLGMLVIGFATAYNLRREHLRLAVSKKSEHYRIQ